MAIKNMKIIKHHNIYPCDFF